MYNFIQSLITRHKKVQVEILKFKLFTFGEFNIYQFQFIITNQSQLPISINNISVNNIYCKFDPTRITDEISTAYFPIVLGTLESKGGWLEFKTTNNIDIHSMKFSLYTSRGPLKDIIPLIDNIIDAHPCRYNDL